MNRTVGITFLVLLFACFLLVNPGYAAKIIWISGIVQDVNGVDSDQGFVDLLTNAGYDVQRENDTIIGKPLTEAQKAVMESADLVIVSRATNSSTYNELSWNSVKVPLILTTSYLSRDNRWKWLNNNDILGNGDSGAPLYEAVDPAHPIFAGITLDANNQVDVLDESVGSGNTSLPGRPGAGNGQVLAVAADTGVVAIAFWPQYTVFHDGTTQWAADHRMLFNCGARETAAGVVPAYLQGMYNLTPDGDALFLNAVDWMINLPPSPPPPFNVAIDAQKDLFYEGLTGPDDGYLQIRWFAHNNNGKPDNDADLSAKLWASWDETYLYLYEEVKDNVVHLNHATSWQDDVLEVYIDPDPTATVTTAQLGFHLTALDSADADPAALAGVVNLLGYNIETGATPADYARRKTADGYVLECRVAWDSLQDATRKITPAVDNVFGMAIMNHDNDVAQREGSISWAAVLNDNVWNTPNHHGAIKFLADNRLQFIPTSARSGLTNTLPYDGTIPPITIDATKDAFYDQLTGPDDGYLQIRWFAHNNNGKPDNDKDLSAKFWASWDETYLYFYEEVKDNVVNLNHATSWQDDVLEVYVDPDPAAAVTTAQLGFHITALDSAQADQAALAGVINLQGYNLDTGATTADYARKKTADGYVLEGRVKWEVLKDATRVITPAVDNVFGLALMNHDNDVAQREGSISWAAVLNDNVWNTPNHHGAIKFLPDGKLMFDPTSARSGLTNTLPYDGSLPPIAIDAERDPFYETLTGPDNGYIHIPARAHNDNGAPENNKDLSALLWVSWDADYLYMYEEVADNVVNLNHATSWQDDVLEVYLDPDPTAAVTQGQIGFHLTALDSADADPAAYAGVINLRGHNIDLQATTEDYARKKTANGYVLECRVPWDIIKDATRGPIVPQVGNVFGMATMNHDNDVAQREGTISWAAVLLDNVWNTPNNHGTVEFLADGKLKLTAMSTRSGLVNDSAAVWYDPSGVVAVEVETQKDVVPETYSLSQNYPNPFNPITTINFALPQDVQVKLTVFDILGREVVTLVDEKMQAGTHSAKFDASSFATGVYFYRLKAGNQTFQKKMMLLK